MKGLGRRKIGICRVHVKAHFRACPAKSSASDDAIWKYAESRISKKEKKASYQRFKTGLTRKAGVHGKGSTGELVALQRSLERKYNGPVPKFELSEILKNKGWSQSKIDNLIETLKIKGDIYEPRSGYLQRL